MEENVKFNRINKVQVGDKLIDGLFISFKVKRDRDEPNEAEIVIYNLSKESREQINENDPVELVSGHEGEENNIYKGKVKTNEPKRERDFKTVLRCIDANFASNRTYSKSFSSGTNDYFIRDIANSTGLTVRSIDMDVVQNNLGRNLVGKGEDLIKMLAEEGNAMAVISDSVVDIKKTAGRILVVIDSESGLLKEPKLFKEDGKTKYEVESLFDNRVLEGERVIVESSSGSITLDVERLEHESTESEYKTTLVGDLVE